MKHSAPKILLLGSNSGNNLGDAAIMSGIMDAISKIMPTTEFIVPSTKPKFTSKNYDNLYNVKAVNIMPWTGSLRLLGIPTIYHMWRSDVALICDGIIFGKKIFNPFFNWLITLIFLVPFARLFNCKLVCYSCGIGPFPSKVSKVFARYLINSCDLVIMRENDSKKLAEEIGVRKNITITGDAAFINPVSASERAVEIAKKEGLDLSIPWFGVNVTKYIDSWLSKNEQVKDKSEFIHVLANAINQAKIKISKTSLSGDKDTRANSLNGENDPNNAKSILETVIFSTHPMDKEFCDKLAQLVSGKVIHNGEYLSHDIQALMRRCKLFMGMRFHSLVLASAVEAPIIGLIYAPKVRGYMRLLDSEDLAFELAEVSEERLANKIFSAWNESEKIKLKQKQIVDGLKIGAVNAARTIKERYFADVANGKMEDSFSDIEAYKKVV